ncbi:MAG: S8 family serine peptidase, partial [Candidatus ainarchaeum sp.]|nr:S8 family serine peptidase [Candidatus ainarchaeum sp.]
MLERNHKTYAFFLIIPLLVSVTTLIANLPIENRTVNVSYVEGLSSDFSNMLLEVMTSNGSYAAPYEILDKQDGRWAAVRLPLPEGNYSLNVLASAGNASVIPSAYGPEFLEITYFGGLEPDFSNLAIQFVDSNGDTSDIPYSIIALEKGKWATISLSRPPMAGESVSVLIQQPVEMEPQPDSRQPAGEGSPWVCPAQPAANDSFDSIAIRRTAHGPVSATFDGCGAEIDGEAYDLLASNATVRVIAEGGGSFNPQGEGVIAKHALRSRGMHVLEIRRDSLAALIEAGGTKIHLDRPMDISLTESIPLIRADQARAAFGLTGAGMSVCLLDTGVNAAAPQFDGMAASGHDFVNDDNDSMDDNGHGTLMASTIHAIAPEAKIIAVKVLDSSGHGYSSDIIAGIDYCRQLAANDSGLRIISMSFGGGSFTGWCDGDPLSIAVEDAYEDGILPIASSGNGGSGGITAPACAMNATAVASTSKTDTLSPFSNINPMVDLLAPGEGITAEGLFGPQTMSGTSVSAAHAAGAAALLWQTAPDSAPAEIGQRFATTGIPVWAGSAYYPRIDVLNAITNNLTSIPEKPPVNGSNGTAGEFTAALAVTSINLNATSPNNKTTDDLTCNYAVDAGTATAAVAWYRNGAPLGLLYMPFEGNSSNALLDYSGNGADGANSGAVWNATGGPDGNGSFEFDGTASYINAQTFYNSTLSQLTVMLWIRPKAQSDWRDIISKETGDYATAGFGLRRSAADQFAFTLYNGGKRELLAPSAFDDAGSTWYHVAGTYDGTTMRLYVNGAEVSTLATSGNIVNSIYSLQIGRRTSASDRWIYATLDDVRVYNYSLSADQVLAIYQGRPDWISQSETETGDVWQCRVTPFSSTAANSTVSSNNLTIIVPPLGWDRASLGIGTVFQGSSAASNATVTASGNHVGVTVAAISGNGTGFITASPTSLGNMNDTDTGPVQFSCAPSQGQATGHYEAVFRANSSSFTSGDDITVTCTVAAPTTFSVQKYYLPMAAGTTSAYAPFTGGQTNVNSVPFATISLNETTTTDYWRQYVPDIYFNSSGVIVERNNAASSTMNVIVTVVQFASDSVRVQDGTFSLGTGSTTASIGSSVNLSRSALIFYYESTDATDNYQDNSIRGRISGVNELNFSLDPSSTTGTKSGHWYVFESLDGAFTVQSTALNFASAGTTATGAISAVQMNKTFLIASYSTSETSDDPRDGSLTVNLTSTTVVTGTRLGTPAAVLNATVYAITFAGNELVQRGYFNYGTATTQSGTIAAVNTSLSMAWNPVLTGRMASDSTASYGLVSAFHRLNLTSSTALTGTKDRNIGNTAGAWEVVSWVAPSSVSSLAWNQSTLSIGSVVQGASFALNATLTSTGNNANVTVRAVSGNGTAFINASPTSLGDMSSGNSTGVRFNCSPSASQAAGYYAAVFKANSSTNGTGNNITVSCTVAAFALNLAWNQSAIALGSVVQAMSNASNATATATGNHTAVKVTAVAGNGTGVITASPTSLGDMSSGNSTGVKFNCSPSISNASGYYEATFKVNSSNYSSGSNITAGCTVLALNLAWNQSTLGIGSVSQNTSSTKNATATATGNHANVAVAAVAGNGTAFISVTPASIGSMANGQVQQAMFNCSPNASQALGYYVAVFKLNSSNLTSGSNITVSCTVAPPVMHNFTIIVAYDHNDTWFGDVIVNATVTNEDSQAVTGASVNLTVTPPTGRGVYPRTVAMLDDGAWPDAAAGDGIYATLFDVSLSGAAYTNGTMGLNVSAVKSGYNDGYNDTRSFFTFVVRRWYGSATQDVYADYRLTDNGNGTWTHNVTDVRIYSANTAANNVTVKIPIINQPNIYGLQARGVNAYKVLGNNTIVLYLNVTSGGTTMVNYSFLAASDLVLTLNDKYQTSTIGERIGKNGFVVWNSHIQKESFGIGFAAEGSDATNGQHSVGEDVGMKVVDGESADNQSYTVDCMERTGIVENSTGTMAYATCASCGSYYEWNIHWKSPDDASSSHLGGEIVSATPDNVTVRMTDHGSTNEWGSTSRYNVTKSLTFYAGKNYEKLNFTIMNIGTVPLNTTLVWGREPWVYAGGSTDQNDRGAIPTGWPQVNEEDYTWQELTSNWFGFYDDATNYGTAVIFPANTSAGAPTVCAHLDSLRTPLGTSAGQNLWPWTITHAADPNAMLDDMFCNWQFGALAAGANASAVFYHWGGYSGTGNGLMDEMATAADEIDAATQGQYLSWNQTALALGNVSQGASFALNATATSHGSNANVAVAAVAGNGTAFISATPASIGSLSPRQSQQVSFNCSPSAGQAAGYYAAVFNINSSGYAAGANITVSCNVTAVAAVNCPTIASGGTYVQQFNYIGAPNSASPFTLNNFTCVKIAASNVVFDCNGFNMTDNGTSSTGTSYGILVNGSLTNVTVRNCQVSNYSYGVFINASNNSNFI